MSFFKKPVITFFLGIMLALVPFANQQGQIASLEDQISIYEKVACLNREDFRRQLDQTKAPDILSDRKDLWEQAKKNMLSRCD